MKQSPVYLIDATAFCYRAYYALPELATSFGQPTNAIYGFTTMLKKILKKQKPQYAAVCFDVSRATFRMKKFAEYKIDRPPMPDNLSSQIPLIKDIIRAYGITITEREGFEADDVIASLNKKAHDHGMSVTIISSDKDMLQLVDRDTLVISPSKDEGMIYDTDKVIERFGIPPKGIPDMLALMGDSVDGIPGVPGIGEKTAIELVKQFGSVEGLFAHIDQVKQPNVRAALVAQRDRVKLNKELVMLDQSVDLDLAIDKLKVVAPDFRELYRLFKYFEFQKLLKYLPDEPARADETNPPGITDSQVVQYLGTSPELYLYYQDGRLFVRSDNKFYGIEKVGRQTQKALADPVLRKVGFDLKKTAVALAQEGTRLAGCDFDLMLAAYILNPSRPEYGMSQICGDYLPELASVRHISVQKCLEVMPSLKSRLSQELRDKSLIELFEKIEMPLVSVLADMELTGIALDVNFLHELSSQLERRLITIIDDIYRISGCEFNINSPKQLGNVLFEVLKLPVVKRTKTGYSTDEEVLRTLAPSHALPAHVLEYRQLTKLKSTYVDALPQLINPNTGRIHTSFHQTGTETGRLSSSDPNVQNIPIKTEIGSQIRKGIIAFSGGSVLLSCDYSQIELRILAHLSGDDDLITAFLNGKDIHATTASLIYGIGEHAVTEAQRDIAKRVNFGITYGLTSYGLARDLNIPIDQAQAFIDAYFARYPTVRAYMQDEIQRARRHGFVKTILGRRRYLPDIHNKNQAIRQFAERQAVNTPIQGSASDLIKMAMVVIHDDIDTKKLASRMIMQIHDELLFDVPQEEFGSFAGLVRERMEHVLELKVPIVVSVKKGKNWLEMEEVQ